MRRRRRKETDPSDPCQQANLLIRLALDDNTTIDERRNAALKAVKHIDKYDLRVVQYDADDVLGKGTTEILQAGSDAIRSGKQLVDLGNMFVDKFKKRRR